MALLDSKQLNPKLTGSFILSGSTQTFIGASDFQGSITASGDISGSGNIFGTGNLDIDGTSNLASDLYVGGNITGSNNISASGYLTVSGDISLSGGNLNLEKTGTTGLKYSFNNLSGLDSNGYSLGFNISSG